MIGILTNNYKFSILKLVIYKLNLKHRHFYKNIFQLSNGITAI